MPERPQQLLANPVRPRPTHLIRHPYRRRFKIFKKVKKIVRPNRFGLSRVRRWSSAITPRCLRHDRFAAKSGPAIASEGGPKIEVAVVRITPAGREALRAIVA